MKLIALMTLLLCGGFLADGVAAAQASSDSTDRATSRPFVPGGYYDKPFVTRLFGRTAIGGYIEALWKFDRTEGISEGPSFEARRFNLFTHSVVAERVRVAAELEFEHGTDEIKLEFAFVDFEIHPMLIFRGGILLSPIGKFNLAHDSPLNNLTERPLVSTLIIPTAFSEAGMGLYGSFFPTAESRLTYELYAVNGLHDGVLSGGEGTRFGEGRGAFEEDNNHIPSFVGRLAYSPFLALEIGASFHTGPYNRFKIDGVQVDEKRDLTIAAVDWEYRGDTFDVMGEYVRASIDIPPALRGLFAEQQQGIYAQVNYHFGKGWISAMPRSRFTLVGRYDGVDLDAGLQGDARERFSIGLNFRPVEDTVLKLDYRTERHWSRVNVPERSVGLNLSVASYF